MGLYPGGLISGIIYSRGKWMGLYPEGLKPGGALKWDLTVWEYPPDVTAAV